MKKLTKEQIKLIVEKLESSEHLILLISDGENHDTFLLGDIASTMYSVLTQDEEIFEMTKEVLSHVLVEQIIGDSSPNCEPLN